MRTALLALVVSAAVGCSFSQSSESLSNSISSPSRSSSASSRGGGGESREPESKQDTASYAEDVTQLAVTYARQGGDIGAFRSAVSRRATARGITNWEVDSTTCRAIGRGVAAGGMAEDRFAEFARNLFGDDLTKQSELRKGYQAVAQPTAP